MKNFVPIPFIIFLFATGHSFAQFFEKTDEDFKFNGTDLGALNYDQTKNCTLIKETESYRVYAPKNEELKTKKFTLRQIRYYTDFRNQIWQIEAVNAGGMIEHASIRLDMAEGASNKVDGSSDSLEYRIYRQMRTLDEFEKETGNDTATVRILMMWYLSRTEDYRQNHSFLPVIGKSIKQDAAKDFLFSYQEPDVKSTAQDLKWLTYHNFGMELYIRSDTIMQATVYNKDKKYKQYKGGMPYELSISDTRGAVKEKMGDPSSIGGKGNVFYYNQDNLQIHFTFSNAALKQDPKDDDVITSVLFALKK